MRQANIDPSLNETVFLVIYCGSPNFGSPGDRYSARFTLLMRCGAVDHCGGSTLSHYNGNVSRPDMPTGRHQRNFLEIKHEFDVNPTGMPISKVVFTRD